MSKLIDDIVEMVDILNNQPIPEEDRYAFINPLVFVDDECFNRLFRVACGNCINASQYRKVRIHWWALRQMRTMTLKSVFATGSIGEINGMKIHFTEMSNE